MKQLYIIRHATAIQHGAQNDFARTLDVSAKVELEFIGKYIQKKGWKTDTMICSAALRTKETCEQLALHLGIDAGEILQSEELYNAPYESYLKTICKQNNQVQKLTIVGHNPGISHLATFLANNKQNYNLPTCGLVLLQFKIDNWQELSMGSGQVLDFVIP